MDRLRVWLEKLRTGLWPIPLGMAAAALLLFNGALALDGLNWSEDVLRRWHLFSGSGDDARNLLSTLVGAIITMSSVVFSITIVVLSLAANQFGTRLIRTYMASLRTKLTLGLLAMTIIYCLVALRSVQKDMTTDAVPHVVVSAAWLLGVACVLVLLFFLHFVSRSIMADEVIRCVANELTRIVTQLPPLEAATDSSEQATLPGDFDARSEIVRSRHEGYVQAVKYEQLLTLASRHDVHIQLGFRAGAFMCKDGWLGRVYPREALNQELATAIDEQILIGRRRTPTQDLEFMIRHLVDIALRALSPGINDANTSLVVIDRLRGALCQLAGKHIALPIYRDQNGVVRVVGKPNNYAGVLGAALNQIRQAAAEHPAVIIELIRALSRIGEHARLAAQRDALVEHARLARDAGVRATPDAYDQAAIERAFDDTIEKLNSLFPKA
ncbi:DUF2254 domain-containing protein [Steroidobacter sp. S1-65]|uniref:DUF2254 domain-containing protein n=1 Tax=Steroidobacter gossypii TaxID=2805490 RepID=A0ABS1WVJ4_9GAMM|nr:DUF2254 domain-containing protein [Steroidobacter gossypii]MBM0104997.1 DUF2254 domain-containing protein [Steroidobacter gossypii]